MGLFVLSELTPAQLKVQTAVVEHTVKEHLDWLHGRLKALYSQFVENAGREKANHLRTEIGAIELAIAHFEAALKIEKRIVPPAT